MRYASVCSGVEAASLAWMPLGWEPVWFSEIEPFPCAVLKERFPGVPNLGDMTEIEGEKYRGTVDLLVGGTPCQGFSVAGKHGGLDDPRSALCLAYCRLLETMRPRWFVWENVPGVFSNNGGDDFRSFLRKIDEIGYSCAWRVLDAQYVRVDGYPRAVPQRRRRVFVVGHSSGDWRYPASVLFEPGSLLGDTPPRRIKGKGVARSLTASTGEAIEVMATGQANAETATDHCVNLTCNHEAPIICSGFSGGQGKKAGGIGYREEVTPAIRSSESGGNQVPDILCQYGDVAGTLTSRHDSSPCADRGMSIVYENHAQDSRVKPCGECSPQINAKAGTGGGNLPIVLHECYPTNSMIIGKDAKDGDRQTTGIGNDGDPSPTIGTSHHHAVAMRHSVRRLLPLETERLMGFPEVDVLEIGKMTKDEFIAWELASGNITVDFSAGKVFSCRTGGGTPCPPHELEGTILGGYKVVSLREKEVKKQCRVHRILWIAAHGIIPDGYVIDHINNDKLDNRLCNLQLLRPEENSTKAAKDGLYLTGEDHPKTKLTDEQKNDIITLYETEYYSVRRLAAMYGVSKSRIHQLVKRQGWTQIPWRGKSAEDCPDSPRYKACGNSMCVNVMRWIGMRIEHVERQMNRKAGEE